jgi:beta-phosphoglucomutase family hydrolase
VTLPADVEAVLFDLDGVITKTATVHAAAWKQVFDAYLAGRARRTGEQIAPFDVQRDYYRYVDGKPRVDGVETFLSSRGISLPRGDPSDPPERETLYGIGRRKDAEFLRWVAEHGVEPFPSTVALVGRLREAGVPMAVFSASRNCREVLEAAGVEGFFDAIVDGRDAARLGLPGKPDPATLLEAARQLGVHPRGAAVVEDSRAGVEAGRAGGFCMVVGVDRGGGADALLEAGADAVVTDLAQVGFERAESRWRLVYRGFEPEQEGLREALCTTGNGYFATRGAAPEARADGVHYPGTYVAGVFNRLASEVAGRTVENESMVNLPNWLPLTFRIEDGAWFQVAEVELVAYEQEFDLRRGVLSRRLRYRDQHARHTSVLQRRFTSMDDPHLAALQTTLRAEDWSGSLTVRSGLDGAVENSGVERYRGLPSRHLVEVETQQTGADVIELRARTSQSRVEIVEAARTALVRDGQMLDAERRLVQDGESIAHEIELRLAKGEEVTIEKTVALFTARDPAISEPSVAARRALDRTGRFEQLLDAHTLRWDQLWRRIQLRMDGGERTRLILNLHVFHLLQTVSEHSIDLDAGMPARGLHGEAYRGHIFWDELFAFPFLTLNLPDVSRSLLMYRYRRLPEARAAARAAGYAGAMFPWQSGSDGREETQVMHLNPRSGRWLPDNSHRQRHINIALAYNLWHYHKATGDVEFLSLYGAELLLEIARFWASIASYDDTRGRFVITGVMGPDEYHDAYPDALEPGLSNNAYTNGMAAWVLWRGLDAIAELSEQREAELREQLELSTAETDRWDEISRRMFIPFHDGEIISAFEGYERLPELDWEAYRARYGDIHRLDRILEAEGDSTNRYKVSKQADVLVLFFLLSAEELVELFDRLEYAFDPAAIPANIDYYLKRTSHGSTLSRVVDSWVLARSKRPEAWQIFREALESDIGDIQGGTTPEGIHLGAMAGTVDLLQRGLTGIEWRGDVLRVNPRLPKELTELEFTLRHRRHWGVRVRIADGTLRVSVPASSAQPLTIAYRDDQVELAGGESFEARIPGAG